MARQADSYRRLSESEALAVKNALVPLGCTRAVLSQLESNQYVLLCGRSGLQCLLFANNPDKPRETNGVTIACPESLAPTVLLSLLPPSP